MVYYNLSGYNSNMFLVGILSWWYGEGLMNRPKIMKRRLVSSADFFSINLMVSTLFAPFRQISAGQVSGPIDYQIRAFFDRLISRFIGAFMRLSMIIAGVLSIIFQAVFGLITVIIWVLLPLAPVVGLIVTITGWIPG